MTSKEKYLNALLERIKEFPPELPSGIRKYYLFDIDNVRIDIDLYEAGKTSTSLMSNIYQGSICTIDETHTHLTKDLIATKHTDPNFFEELLTYLQSLEKNSMEAFFEEQSNIMIAPKSEFYPVYEDIKKIEYHKSEIINITKKYHKNFFQKLFNK